MESKRPVTNKDYLAVFERYERLIPSWIKTARWLWEDPDDKQSGFFKDYQESVPKVVSILKQGSSISIEMTKKIDKLAELCKELEEKIVSSQKRFDEEIVTAESEQQFRFAYLAVFERYERLISQWRETVEGLYDNHYKYSKYEKKREASADQQSKSLNDLQDQITEATSILESKSFISSAQVAKIEELQRSCKKFKALFSISPRKDEERAKFTKAIQDSELKISAALTKIKDIYQNGSRENNALNLLLAKSVNEKPNSFGQRNIDEALYEWAQGQSHDPVISLYLKEIENQNIWRKKAIEALAQSYRSEIKATRNSLAQINSKDLGKIFEKSLRSKVLALGFTSDQERVEKEKKDPFPTTTTTPADDHKGTLAGLRKQLDNAITELRKKEQKIRTSWDHLRENYRKAPNPEILKLIEIVKKENHALVDEFRQLKKRLQLVDLKIKRESLEGYDGRLFSATGEQGALQKLTEKIKKIEKEIKLSRQSPMELTKSTVEELAKFTLEDEPKDGDIEIPDSPFPEAEEEENIPKKGMTRSGSPG